MSGQLGLFEVAAPRRRPPTLFDVAIAVPRWRTHPGPELTGKMLGKSDRRIGMTKARHRSLLHQLDGRIG